ncbi:MAG TPA: hypothetical protein VFA75_12615 [Nevskia sp.]|nr:hypothetical protein [Nevskia sp.]
MEFGLGEKELMVLQNIAAGRDPFCSCQVKGDYGQCMLALAALRRAGLIDHHDRITDAGRGALVTIAA